LILKTIALLFIFFCTFNTAIAQTDSNRANSPEVEKGKDGYLRTLAGDKWIINAPNGDLLTKQGFEQIRLFKSGRAAVQQNSKWGFIDLNGKQTIPCIYDLVIDFKDTTALVVQNNQWKKINRNGRLLSEQLSQKDFTAFGLPNLIGSTLYFDSNAPNQNSSSSSVQINNSNDVIVQTQEVTLPSVPCPNNITFENGNFGNWSAFTGSTSCFSSRNRVTLSSSSFINNRHTMLGRSTSLDPYGFFPVSPQDGSNFCVRLGNTSVGAQAESISYNISVPANATNFNITYRYAVVFQDPNHAFCEQPRFVARLVDPLTGESLPCGTFEHVSSSGIPGFFDSPVSQMVKCKPWTKAFINLSPYAGRNLRLEFFTVDCTQSGHWGYAYVDVDNNCSLTADVNYDCDPPNKTVLNGPPGFQGYKWWESDFSKELGNKEQLTLNPGKTLGTKLWVEVLPYAGLGCRDTLPVTIVANYPVANFDAPIPQCERGNIFRFKSSSTISKGAIALELWDFGDGTTATGSNVTHTYKSPGIYKVRLVAVGDNNCKDTIIKNISVNQSPIVSLKSDAPIILCKGESVLLNVPKASGQTYQWLFGGTVIAGATLDTLRVTKDGVYAVSVQNTFGCSANGSSVIRVIDADIVQPDTTICRGTSITLGPLSVKAGQTVLWSTGATSPSIVVNPTVKTKYLVTVTDGASTCSDSIVVDVRSSELKLTNPAAVCSPAEINLTASAITVGSTPGLIYTYWKDANATQNLANPDKVSVSGTYYMVGTSSTGCKSDPTPVIVTVNPLPVANIVTPLQTTICDKSTLTLTATGGTSYQWLLNGAAIAGATSSTYAASLAGSYEVNVIALGCTSKVATPVNLSLIKAAIPKFSNSIACVDVPVSFFNESDTLSSGLVNWAWDFGDGQGAISSNPVHTYKRAATFVVKLTVTPRLCSSLSASFTKNMTVENPPPGIKYPNVYAIKNTATQLSARFLANGYSYLWTPSIGLNNGSIQKPIFNAGFEQKYRIRLTSAVGCVTIDSVSVSVFENSDIFVPKAFSPNKDGKNDLLFPFLVNIKTLKFFRIYNRWGQLMYQTSDFKQGWDGVYNNIPQPLDTYTWIVEGIDVNGVAIFKKGQTVLLR
jgi:gliding motility-associated-like protein